MGLPESLIHRLQHMQFNKPTPVQAQAIPVAMQGKDILGSAQTGTGKTGAFIIPMITKLLANPHISGLILTPTRELAAQVMSQIQIMIGKKTKIKTALLIGGEPIHKQFTQLKGKPHIIVGTPGRINDHLTRKSLTLHNTEFLVLDETDRMLDMGFSEQIEQIIQHIPSKRQTLLFSATLPHNITKMASSYLNNPVRIAIDTSCAPAPNIKQDTLRMREEEKYPHLLSQLNDRTGSIIVFVKTKHGTEKMASRLLKEGHQANAIHGDLRQHKRNRTIADFRNKKYRILVATDVAARGLDIPHIEHVINYDLPQCAEDYIHRIGRTARAGAEGHALNLVAPADGSKWRAIHRLLNPEEADKFQSEEKTDNQKRKHFKVRHKKFNTSPSNRTRSKPQRKSHSSRRAQ